MRKVLVIKLGALGDLVLAFAAMARIRQAHPEAEVTLLTTPAFATLATASPSIDRVETDGRPRGIGATLAMLRRLRRTAYNRVYDLQTSSRSAFYFHALQPRPPEWSGVAAGCSHPHRNPDRDRMHTLERQADQLKDAGVWPDAPTVPGTAPPPDLSWAAAAAEPLTAQAESLALLIPGGSAHRPEKRWPAARYAALARALAAAGLTPAIAGGPAERELAAVIVDAEPIAVDLTGRTDLLQLAALGARAALAIGNDTGPTHLVAAAGAPTLTLFSDASDPALTAPRGLRTAVLQRPALAKLPLAEVLVATDRLIGSA